jgi:hypothetical protein
MIATISPTTLADLRRKGDKVILIDVRTPAEFGAGGAVSCSAGLSGDSRGRIVSRRGGWFCRGP